MNNSANSTSQHRWILIGLALTLAFNFAIRWHLRDLPLERDEGEYAYAGQLILQGIPPYKLAFNMKFPGVYFMYALLMAIFGQSAADIHAGIFVVTSLTAVLIFFIGRELLSEAGSLVATVIYIGLAALPKAAGLAGHATHFVSLFVCAGVAVLLMARRRNSRAWWFVSGTAFGLAILMKQHAVFFPFFILVWLLWKGLRRATQVSAVSVILFCAGCAIPFIVTAVGFACAGLWHAFVIWTFQYASQYVSMLPFRAVPEQFATGFDPVFESGIWVWIFGVVGLICLWRRHAIADCGPRIADYPKPSPHPGPLRSHPMGAEREQQAYGVLSSPDGRQSPSNCVSGKSPELAGLIFLAGLAAACPGFYFRNHYFIMAMPGLALLNAAFILAVAKAFRQHSHATWVKYIPVCLAAFIVGDLLVNNAGMWFDGTPLQLSRELYAANPFTESIEVADYLKEHTSPADTIAVLGSEPEIFFLSHRHSASGFIYFYALTEPQPLAPQMRREFISQIETARPKYVVSVNMELSWFSLISPESLQYASAIQNWWAGYSTNYELVGAVKISPDRPSQFFWNEQSLNPVDATNNDLLIYRRRSNH
ncbi:MAG TPA: glycosyltransferase family 39 protein [Verrucomicrobiae bacterium]|nr:glycosyltransferase family 39 protein [Verrucomicrobiae bacterium]